jgi:hypothetical protein
MDGLLLNPFTSTMSRVKGERRQQRETFEDILRFAESVAGAE